MIILKITIILVILLIFDIVVFKQTDFNKNLLISSVVVFAMELNKIRDRL